MEETQPPPPPQGPWGASQEWAASPRPRLGVATAEMEQPQTIRLAVKLMLIGAALAALSFFIAQAQRDEIRDLIADDNPSYSQTELDEQMDAWTVRNVTSAIFGVGLWIWMAQMNGKGRSWARVVASVLGGINLLLTGVILAAGLYTAVGFVQAIVNVALAVSILILLYRPESSEYYDAMSPRQPAY